jgi:D-sedoheptulose 7-phosphate isomerase
MEGTVKKLLQEAVSTHQASAALAVQITAAAKTIIEALRRGNKILVAGNGGSAAEATHLSGELLHKFEKHRRALPAISLSAELSAVTAAGNDDGYDTVFSRQVEALGNPGDVFIGLTTSGNSKNINEAFKAAKTADLKTICLNGKSGGTASQLQPDHNIIVNSGNTARIQEVHLVVIHIWCSLIDEAFHEL